MPDGNKPDLCITSPDVTTTQQGDPIAAQCCKGSGASGQTCLRHFKTESDGVTYDSGRKSNNDDCVSGMAKRVNGVMTLGKTVSGQWVTEQWTFAQARDK